GGRPELARDAGGPDGPGVPRFRGGPRVGGRADVGRMRRRLPLRVRAPPRSYGLRLAGRPRLLDQRDVLGLPARPRDRAGDWAGATLHGMEPGRPPGPRRRDDGPDAPNRDGRGRGLGLRSRGAVSRPRSGKRRRPRVGPRLLGPRATRGDMDRRRLVTSTISDVEDVALRDLVIEQRLFELFVLRHLPVDFLSPTFLQGDPKSLAFLLERHLGLRTRL